MNVEFTRSALNDIEKIRLYTINKWGRLQADNYIDDLQSKVKKSQSYLMSVNDDPRYLIYFLIQLADISCYTRLNLTDLSSFESYPKQWIWILIQSLQKKG